MSGRLGLVAGALWVQLACGREAPAPSPTPVPEPVSFGIVPETEAVFSPYALPSDASVDQARSVLETVVRGRGLDPKVPWALGHALLALGADAQLADGRPALDALWTHADVDGHDVSFPTERDGVPIEPHAGLVLKGLTDLGVPPTRAIRDGAVVADLYTTLRSAVWVDGANTWTTSWNDTPWALQGLSAWAPAGATWTAGGHTTSLDEFTHASVLRLAEETAFLAEARAAGEAFQKRGQGIFAYTCGGAHLLQGTAHAVARGFGGPEDREVLRAQAELQRWRYGQELAIVDAYLEQAPQYAEILTVQRLKFVGHDLETTHLFAALGIVDPDDPAIAAHAAQARSDLVETVGMLVRRGMLDRLDAVRAEREQTYLDLIGDGAHAMRGLDLSSGDASARR